MNKLDFRLLALAALAAAAGCGVEKPPSATTDLDGEAVVTVDLLAAAPASLPACTATNSGTLAFVASPAGLWSCNNSLWSAVACATSNAGQILYASTSQSVVAACVHQVWLQVQGATGATGPTGATGTTPRALVKVKAEPHSANCLNGGQRVDLGVDTSGDGTLQAGEISQTTYVCDGADEPPAGPINGRPPISVSRGFAHACAVLSDGSVWCWGAAESGQLGRLPSGITCGGVTPCLADPHPIQVPGVGGTGTLANATAVVTGTDYSCALISNGTVTCWGANGSGQLGQGNNTPPATMPVTVKGPSGTGSLTGVTALVGGSAHVCALLSSGGVDCWGDNLFGEIGNGTFTGPMACGYTCIALPTPVTTAAGTNLTGATSIYSASSAQHTCVIQGTGSPAVGGMRCWGMNQGYQLGLLDGLAGPEYCSAGQSCSTRALAPMNMTDAVSAAAGENFSCGVHANRTTTCWGVNTDLVLGIDPAQRQDQDVPGLLVTNVAGAVAVAGAVNNACAVLAGGSIACWGATDSGQLGVGFDYPYTTFTPYLVPNLFGVRQLSAGKGGACAIADRGVFCWGANGSGQVGDGNVGTAAFLPRLVQ
jgi:alpha-tubulin suppressor-like RCC1 family protein